MEKDILKEKMDDLAKSVYRVTKNFPKDEVYGITSQLRRAALSVILNYIEGFARLGSSEFKHFLHIAYGSLKETQYLISFCFEETYLSKGEHERLSRLADDIGALLWKRIELVKKQKYHY